MYAEDVGATQPSSMCLRETAMSTVSRFVVECPRLPVFRYSNISRRICLNGRSPYASSWSLNRRSE